MSYDLVWGMCVYVIDLDFLECIYIFEFDLFVVFYFGNVCEIGDELIVELVCFFDFIIN